MDEGLSAAAVDSLHFELGEAVVVEALGELGTQEVLAWTGSNGSLAGKGSVGLRLLAVVCERRRKLRVRRLRMHPRSVVHGGYRYQSVQKRSIFKPIGRHIRISVRLPRKRISGVRRVAAVTLISSSIRVRRRMKSSGERGLGFYIEIFRNARSPEPRIYPPSAIRHYLFIPANHISQTRRGSRTSSHHHIFCRFKQLRLFISLLIPSMPNQLTALQVYFSPHRSYSLV